MRYIHYYHRKEKIRMVMYWKEIVCQKKYDFSPEIFVPCIMLSF